MKNCFVLKYSHKGKDFEGWYTIAVFKYITEARKSLDKNKEIAPDFNYKIETVVFFD